MSVEDGIYNRLSTFAGLTALVSTRIFPDIAPQNAVDPFVTYDRISTVVESNLVLDADVVASRFQMSAWSQTKGTAIAIAGQLRAAFKRYRGTNMSVVFLDAYLINESDLYDTETTYYQIALDFEIWHRE